jgi:hypothetical protein
MTHRIACILIAVASYPAAAQQPVKTLEPVRVDNLDLSVEGERQFEADQKLIEEIAAKLNRGIKLKDLPVDQQKIYSEWDETTENYWDILGGGCSWYCGVLCNGVVASSTLKSTGDHAYAAGNAHDLNYKTAWVEGVPGDGIGQYLLYKFAPENPRITEIIVVNGYVKSAAAWANNARAKKLKLYVNDRPYAILNLKDQRAAQHFQVDPIGNGQREDFAKLKMQPEWNLKFEILDVYKGLKYDDLAISEIYFDGLDVHCFAKGTKVTVASDQTRAIEDLAPGDEVLSFDPETKRLNPAVVEQVAKVVHHGIVKYAFDNGHEIVATQDHPFLISGKGWASLKPKASSQYKGFEDISKIALGDAFEIVDAQGNTSVTKLKQIEYLDGHYETYTITRLKGGNNFIANGCIVGVEDVGGVSANASAQE